MLNIAFQVAHPSYSLSFRGSASVFTQITAFAFGLPYNINTFYRYTINSVILYKTLDKQFLALAHGSREF
jgi:hypothetical protein